MALRQPWELEQVGSIPTTPTGGEASQFAMAAISKTAER